MKSRYRVAPGREVVFPVGTLTGAGATTLVASAGDVVEVETDRFVRCRVRAGDLIPVTATVTAAPAPTVKE